MRAIFLITERYELAHSVGRYLRFKEGINLHTLCPPAPPADATREERVEWVPQTFRKLATWLETRARQEAGDSALFNAVALIDVPTLSSLDDLDPLDRTKDWPAVVAMLVLAFPEVHWALVSPYEPPAAPLLRRAHFPQTVSFFADLQSLLRLHDKGFSPLFDPAGLRDRIRRHVMLRADAAYLPLRPHCAAAIDEEENYSYFNAYTAYRFGYRCHVVSSHGLMSDLWGEGDVAGSPDLTFEDIYLNFPDRRQSLSRIETRDTEFQSLQKVPLRIFVTGGHRLTAAEQETWVANRTYLSGRKAEGYYSKLMFKPESGVFDIWTRSGLRQKLRAHGGKAPGFNWPPKTPVLSEVGGTHSAPGRLLLIADLLIQRAGRILKNAETVPEAVHGALLALAAEESLGHRTPTTSLEAVSLKHQLEVLAECMFYGVEYHLDTKSRFVEIKREVDSIGIWFRLKTRTISELNAEIGILSELLLNFRNYNQFTEEQATLSKVRHLNRRLWFERHKAWAWLLYPARWYFDQLLGSLTTFVVTLFGWLLAFGGIYGLLTRAHYDPVEGTKGFEDPFMHGFEDVIVTFFGMQPAHDLNMMEPAHPLLVWLTLLVIVLSFVHLGVFVSHLYSIIARR